MREFTAFDPSTGKGTLDTKGVNPNEQLMLYNDSINRLRLHFADGSIGIVPALWNKDYILKNVAMGNVNWEVVDSLNIANNPSSIVYGEVYESGEHVASVNASMQRSVVSSIPGGVSTSVVSLESTGANTSPDGTNIITITDSLGNTFVLDNNGILSFAVKIASALVNIMKTATVDPIIQLGAATHLLEILGNLQIDGNINIANNTPIQALNATAVLRTLLFLSAGNVTVVQAGDSDIVEFHDHNGTIIGNFDANGANIKGKHLSAVAIGDLADWTASGLYLKGNPAIAGPFHFQGNGAATDFQISAISKFSGTGSGTFTHGLKQFNVGIVPDIIIPVTSVVGSQTMGYDTLTTTQVHITTGAALAWVALAMKF